MSYILLTEQLMEIYMFLTNMFLKQLVTPVPEFDNHLFNILNLFTLQYKTKINIFMRIILFQ